MNAIYGWPTEQTPLMRQNSRRFQQCHLVNTFRQPNGPGHRIGVQAYASPLRVSQGARGIVSTPAAASGATTTCKQQRYIYHQFQSE